jgi:hypothetical protein
MENDDIGMLRVTTRALDDSMAGSIYLGDFVLYVVL